MPQVGTVDALTALAALAALALAEQALTVQDATNNGLALGIGLSHKFFIENSLGLDYSKPIPHTREYLTILNGL